MNIQAFLSITTSRSNHVSVSLQNLLFPLFSLKLCPKTLAKELNLPVQFTILQNDICGRVRTNRVQSWRTHGDRTPVEEGIVKMESPAMIFVFYYGGKFKKERDGYLYYEPDNTEVVMCKDCRRFLVFSLTKG
ncbi:uncharacterized protein LOC107638151 [Arachis ipaensis]|uniref:uncharacterized protein LOC107638151 n=1 Tax=Arachis ipaensis TaxID=130454 RepID=UPI000A2B8D63|nr:uncharacterized protein LOC107638151 [Arachis ipaensis]